jgi:hypothetical protein
MNKQKLSKMAMTRVRVRPIARRIDSTGVELPQIDDAWLITRSSREELELRNPRSQHIVPLGTDHVREFMTGTEGGFLILKSQIFLSGRGAVVEPLV